MELASKNRLQFVHHDELFATREEAFNYIENFDNGQATKRPALYAEPMILKYGEDESNPNIILAIGSVGDGETTGSTNNKTYFIDFSRHDEEIKAISAHTEQMQEEINVLSGFVSNIIEACGLDENGSYVKYDNTIITEAESITDAVNKIADYVVALEKKLILSVVDTNTLELDVNISDEGTVLTGNVKLQDTNSFDGKNILKNQILALDNGLFINVALEYSGNGDTLKLVVNDNVESEAELPTEIHLVNGRYVTKTEDLILTLSDESEVVVNLTELASEVRVDTENTTTPIVLTMKRVIEADKNEYGDEVYHSLLTADVRLTEGDFVNNNIIKVHGAGTNHASLYVEGVSSNIKHEDGTVDSKLKDIDLALTDERTKREDNDELLDKKISGLTKNFNEFSAETINAINKEESLRIENDKVLDEKIDSVKAYADEINEDLQTEKSDIRDIVARGDEKTTLHVDAAQESNSSLVLKVNNLEHGTYIEGWAVAKDESTNIIKGGGEGGAALYANVELDYSEKNNQLRFKTTAKSAESKIISLNNAKLSYESGSNVLTFTSNDNTESKIQLNTGSLVKHIDYDREREVLVIYYDDAQGVERTVEVNISDLFKEWDVTKSTTGAIELDKTRIKDGTDILSAKVILSTDKHNIIKNVNGALFVSDEDILNLEKNLDNEIKRATSEEERIETKFDKEVSSAKTRISAAEAKLDVITSPDKEQEGSIANAIKQSKDYTDQEIKNATLSGSEAISISNKKVSLIVNEDEKHLEITSEGLKTVGIDENIATALSEANAYTDSAKEELTEALNTESSERKTADSVLSSATDANTSAIALLNANKSTEGSVDYKIDNAVSDLSATTKAEISDITLVGSESIDITDKKVSVKIDDESEYLTISDGGVAIFGLKKDISDTLASAKEYTDNAKSELNNKINANTDLIKTTSESDRDYTDEKVADITLVGSDSVDITDKVVSVKINKESDYLVTSSEGLEIIGVKDDIEAAKNAAISASNGYTDIQIDDVNSKISDEAEVRESKDTELLGKINDNTDLIKTTKQELIDYTDSKVGDITLNGSQTIDITNKVVSVKHNTNDKYLTEGVYGLETKGIDNAIAIAVEVENDARTLMDDTIIESLNNHKKESQAFSGQLESEILTSVKNVDVVKHNDSELTYDVVYKLNNNTSITAGTINIPKDRFIESVSYKNHILTIVFITSDGTETVTIPLDDLIDVYTASDGLVLNGGEFSIDIVENDKYIKIKDGKLATYGVDDAIGDAKAEAKKYTDTQVEGVRLFAGKAVRVGKFGSLENTISVAISAREESQKYLRFSDAENAIEVFGIDNAIKTSIDTLDNKLSSDIATKADASEVYTMKQVDSKLDTKANKADVYTKTETVSKTQYDQDINTLSSNISTNANNIDKLSSATTQLVKEVSGNTVDIIRTASGACNTYTDTKISGVNANISTLTDKVNKNINDIAALDTKAETLVREASGACITYTDTKVDELKHDVTENTNNISNLSANTQTLVAKVSGDCKTYTDNAVSDLDKKVTANTNQINSLSAATKTLVSETSATTIAAAVKDAKDYTDTKIEDVEGEIRAITGTSSDTDAKLAQEVQDRKDADNALSTRINELVNVDSILRADVNAVSGIANNALATANEAKLKNDCKVNDTATIDFEKTESTNSGYTLSANVKISKTNGNTIKAYDDGIYSNVSDLTYDTGSNKLTFTDENGTKKIITLNSIDTIKNIYFDGETNELVFIYTVKGEEKEVRIDATAFFKGIVGTNDGNVSVTTALTTTQGSTSTGITANLDVNDIIDNTNSTVTLSKTNANRIAASVNIASNVPNNLLKIDGSSNSLFADGSGIAKNAEDIKALSGKVTTNISDITDLKNKVNKISGDVTTISGDVNTNKTDIANIKTDINGVKTNVNTNTTEIAKLKISVDTVSGTANANKVSIENINTNISAISTNVSTLSGQVGTNTSDIAALKTNVSTINNNVTVLSGQVTTNTNDIAALKTKADAISGQVGTNATDIATLKTKVDTISGKTDTNKSDIDTLKTSVSTINNNITVLSGQVGTNTSDIAALKTKVDSVSGEVVNIKSDIRIISGDVSDNKDEIAKLKSDAATTNGNVASISGNVSTINNNITTINGKLGDIEGDIDDINDKLDGIDNIYSSVGVGKQETNITAHTRNSNYLNQSQTVIDALMELDKQVHDKGTAEAYSFMPSGTTNNVSLTTTKNGNITEVRGNIDVFDCGEY